MLTIWDFSKLYPTEDYEVVGEGDNCKVLCSGFYFYQDGSFEYANKIGKEKTIMAFGKYNKDLAADIPGAKKMFDYLNENCRSINTGKSVDEVIKLSQTKINEKDLHEFAKSLGESTTRMAVYTLINETLKDLNDRLSAIEQSMRTEKCREAE